MKSNSFAFSTCWGLSITAVVPWIVGTQFLNAPAFADPPVWEDPCIEEPMSEECGYYNQFLDMQHDFWLNAWAQPYVHGASVMTLDPPEVPDGEYLIEVWLDAGLDYEDPNLSEQEVLDQIVAVGTLQPEAVMYLHTDSGQHLDPDDGTITTVTTTLFAVAGDPLGHDQSRSARSGRSNGGAHHRFAGC